ncbi:MAG: substrate-binding domain-containing protein [Lachnospiraceae bacterium]|nr:substrate-binding domain-containing protein [Lachnospiraceae bacterium]
MITRKEKILWVFYAAVLVFLYLLSSTDLIIKEQKSEVYPLSVIVEDVRDENYVNFRKGMDRAAMELNADVSFITLYEANDADQQLEMILREQQDGARALVLAPVDEAMIEEELAQKRITVPLVLVNGELPVDRISAVITTDFYAMGQQLAAQVIRKHTPEIPVYLFSENHDNVVTRRFHDGIMAELNEAGYQTAWFQSREEDTFRKTIEELVYPEPRTAVIIALDQNSLARTAAILADSSVYFSHIQGLYGRGTTPSILTALDRNLVTGICVTDDFSAGYLSVKRAVEAIGNQIIQEQTVLESYYIEKEDLRRPQYEKMLYPIE